MTSVLIADDHVLFREGLRNIIQHWEDFEVVGEVSNGQEALEMARKLLPDIVLMDISMPVMDGIEATRRLTGELPSVRVVILTMSEEQENLFEAMKSGARGYVLKDIPSRRLHDELRGVMRGEAPLSSLMAAKILEEFHNPKSKTGTDPGSREALTQRELEILNLVVEGLTNAQIARNIYLSENTVKKHLRSILEKLQLNNRVEAAVYALRTGLVD